MKWKVGLDIPVSYTPAINAGENGIILKGEQSNPNKSGIQYELVKKETGPIRLLIRSSSNNKELSAGRSTYRQ
ncbi:hypothetical protein [Rossellomorea aquimaris]|uniref:Uncharacterized protein n=1 Tax=Rossellomorea aquimaris TaxID=189382 RepID=A0A1J6VTD3_9BACI|nr:hypothetical protein [Rossellomorea aquimaris]OIU68541.1 hypothetical protein BHE18_16560 [Rossellomorea aquimaris]